MFLSETPEKFRAEKSNSIDILLTETDTRWLLHIPGTCVEIDPDQPKKDDEKARSDENADDKNNQLKLRCDKKKICKA